MAANTPNKNTVQVLNQKAIEGVDKYLANVKTVTLASTSYTPAAIVAVLQAEIDADKAVDEGRAQFRQQVVAAGLARSKGRAMRQALKTYVLSTFGADAVQTFESFGMQVPKVPGRRSVQSKAQAADKATATRKAQKEAIASVHAVVPSVAPSVVTGPAAVVAPSHS
jgi:hypothetical protein